MIRRTLSIPVFAVTAVGIVAAASGFHYVRGWQLSRLSKTFLDRAREAQQREDWREAAEQFDHYLRLSPEQAAARTELALVFAKGAKSLDEKQRAVALHYRALASALEDSTDELRIGLAELLLQTGRPLEAENAARDVLDRLPEEPRASRAFALARYMQWRAGELGARSPDDLQLLAPLEEALERNPTDIALAEVTATLYREQPAIVEKHNPGLPPEKYGPLADAVLDRAVELNVSNAEALLARHLYRAKYAQSDRERELAEQDLAKALVLAPQHPQILLTASEARYQQARDALADPATRSAAAQPLVECKLLLERLIDGKLAPENSQPHLRLGDVHVLDGELDRALEVWQDALGRFTRPAVRVAFHARIADHLLKAGRVEESKPSLTAIQEILDDLGGTIRRADHLALMQAQGLRQATYDLGTGRYAEAIAQLQRAIARQPQLQPNPQTSHAAWDLMGRAFAGLQDWTAAATAFDRAANFQTEETGSRLAAAEAWLSAGRTELAIDRADQVIKQLEEKQRELDRKASQANQGVELPRSEVKPVAGWSTAWLVLATAELQSQAARPRNERTWTQLEYALGMLEALPNRGGLAAPWRIDFLQADYLALRTDDEADDDRERRAAAEVLRRAEVRYQDRPEFWFHACLAYERLAQPDDAERAWLQLNQFSGAQAEAAIAASRRAAAHEDYSKAQNILESAAPELPPAAQQRLRQELIRLTKARQDLRQMQALFLATLRDRPHDVGALCGLAELALRASDFPTLQKWEGQLAAAGPPGDVWAQYFRISRLYLSATGPRDPRLIEALSEQARLSTLRPNWADGFSLRGAIEQRMEHLEAAAAAYGQAIQLGERRYVIFEQLITCLDQLNKGDEVEKYLARMQSYLPASQRLTELASARQLDENRPEQAIEIARRALERRPGDLNARLWLARLLLVTDRLPEAQAEFEQATQQSPTDARSWNGLFAYYLHVGDEQRARQTLESLEQHAQLDPASRNKLLGRAYAQLGDRSRAAELLARAVEQEPQSATSHLDLAQALLETDRGRAKENLQRALELDPKLARARWLLATILAASGSEADLAAAEQLLDEAGGTEATVEDRRVRAILLAQYSGDGGLNRAILMLEQIIAGDTESTTDRLLLAQFYERRAAASRDAAEAAGNVQKARDQLLNVASRTRAQAADVGVLISFLLRQDRKDEAARWLDRLEDRLAGQARPDPKSIALLIDLRLAQGSVKRCEPWLAKLEATDRDPFRPLIARVKYFAALPNIEAIEPAVEAQALRLIQATRSLKEQSRIARQIGDLYLLVNQLAGAEKWYRTVVKSDPDQFPLLATALVRQNRGLEAIRLCETAAENDTTSRPAIVLTSLLLESGAKREYMRAAEPILAAALKNFPDDPNLVYGVGMLRVLEDRYPEAIVLLRKVVRLNPRHVPALNNLAMLLAESQETRAEGLAFVERAIVHRGHLPTLLDTKGTILLWSGKTQEAVTLLEAAARGSTTDPRHSFHLASAYHELGSADNAQEQLAAALERHLEKQILTPTDRKALNKLRTALTRGAVINSPRPR